MVLVIGLRDKKLNILFRCDSSSQIGLGHVMRCLVLAKEYPEASISFATQKLSGNINDKIIQNGYRLENLNSNTKEKLLLKLQALKIDLLVIDSYKISYKTEKFLKKYGNVTILSLDDTYEKHHCDILLNHNISADAKKYDILVPKACELRCGSKYTLLREEFIKEKNRIKKTSKVTNILLAIGGTDHSQINIKILKVLTKFPDLKVNIVTTTSNKKLEKLKRYTKNIKNAKLRINSANIAKLMRKSDLAIISPSVIANEVYFMKLPFIAIKTAKNQDDMYQYLKKKGNLTLKKFNKNRLEKYLQRVTR